MDRWRENKNSKFIKQDPLRSIKWCGPFASRTVSLTQQMKRNKIKKRNVYILNKTFITRFIDSGQIWVNNIWKKKKNKNKTNMKNMWSTEKRHQNKIK